MAQTSESQPNPLVAPAPYPVRKRLTTIDLMQNAREVVIVHRGEEYLLRITKTGKLILTK